VSDIVIRPAALMDLDAVNAIYNYYVLNSTCTYQTASETVADRRQWFDRHGPAHPVVVAVKGEQVLGWGALSPFHPQAAYDHTVENSVYVRHDAQRRGIGTALLLHLIAQARRIGHRTIIAIIDADQTGSVALHARHGFVQVGRMRQVGCKFDRWLDVVYMQLLP
jgi:phosphinothricin acetyltransferase